MFPTKFSKYKLEHILFWFFYALFWLLVSNSFKDYTQIVNTLIVVFFHALVAYFNIYVLVPRLLQKRHYITYAFSLLFSITLICFPLAIIIYLLSPESAAEKQYNIWTLDFFITNSFFTSYAVGITMILRLILQWYQREKEKSELQRITTETELKFLKSQINPHFLFNCLNSIYALTLKKSDDAPHTVLKLSEMLRYLLYEAGEEKVTIDKEINYLNNYLALERIRLGNRGEILFEHTTDREDYLIEPMLLMPFVENSFKHGLNTQATDGRVSIVLNINSGKLHCTISNNKKEGTVDKIGTKIGGIGIENVKKRLDILYPNKYTLSIKDTESTFEVDLFLAII